MTSPQIADELERLINNQQALLEAMPQMVLLIDPDGSVARMNQLALSVLGDLTGQNHNGSGCKRAMAERLMGLVKSFLEKKSGNSEITVIDGMHLQYYVAPFNGYKGEILYWLIMKDISEHARNREELQKHKYSLETVIDHKINQIKESAAVRKKLSNQLKTIKKHVGLQHLDGKMVGTSKAMQNLHDMILRVADSDATILITGESGTGKEIAADLIHKSSSRKNQSFLKINCSAINDTLLESELFGYEKGAFSGANSQTKGKFEEVNGGTIFLDEIGDVSPRMQSALLRVLQNGEIVRVGSNKPIEIDVRIIAATNANLISAVKEGTFRLDLYYRLNIINLIVPPLRARKEDILELVDHFIQRYSDNSDKEITHISESALNELLAHDWPGNIRELENIIQRAVLISKNTFLSEADLLFDLPMDLGEEEASVGEVVKKFNGSDLKHILSEIEKEAILQKLKTSNGNVAQAAKHLKICKAALYEKMKRYDISAKEHR